MAKKKGKQPQVINVDTVGDPLRNSDWIKQRPGYLESELAAHAIALQMHRARVKAAAEAEKEKQADGDAGTTDFTDVH